MRVLVVCCLLLSATALAREPRREGVEPSALLSGWAQELDARVRAAPQGFPGELSVYVEDVESGRTYGYDAERVTYLSSAIKVVVALEIFTLIDAGRLRLDEDVTFRPEDVRDGVGPLKRRAPGGAFPLATWLELMLVHSDNAAADRLISLAREERLQELLRDRRVHFPRLRSLLGERQEIYARLHPLGAQLSPRQIQQRGRHDGLDERARVFSQMVGRTPAWTGKELAAAFADFYEDQVNSASMQAVGKLLGQLSRCEGLTANSCLQLKALMRACATGKKRIKAGLPQGALWAHKTGTQLGRACDVGLLTVGGNREVVVAACTRNFRRLEESDAVLREVGRAVWETLGPGGTSTSAAGP